MSTQWKGRDKPQSDLGHGLDELLNFMTDEDGNRILFHNGEFYEKNTEWRKRILP